ncbi:MAG: hypothetical protein JTT11_06975 [Candidatus Brockarchaeota archaeon]|nr:hypothetical protein [Candidatus Brockarchaeota archaeon]
MGLKDPRVRGLARIALRVKLCIIGTLPNARLAIKSQNGKKILGIACYSNWTK